LGLYNRPEVAAVPGDVSPHPTKKKAPETTKNTMAKLLLRNGYSQIKPGNIVSQG
jgi:hypothetical protein